MADVEAQDDGGPRNIEDEGPRNIEVYLRLRPVAAPAPDIAVDASHSRVNFTVQRSAASGRAAALF